VNTCPACYGTAPDGLLCGICTRNLTTDLRGSASVMGVAELVDNLHVAQAKQARLSEEAGPGGVKHERMPTNIGAMEAVRQLEFYIGSWARDLTGDRWRPRGPVRAVRSKGGAPGPFCAVCRHHSCAERRNYEFAPVRYVAVQAAEVLLDHVPEIRRHGAVKDLMEEITKAINRGRGVIDVEPFRRFPVGPCPEDGCARTVFALCPAEGSQRPALMACYQLVKAENRPDLGAGFIHSYQSAQFYRAGERIKKKMEKGAAA
jgi:hypothetical protein